MQEFLKNYGYPSKAYEIIKIVEKNGNYNIILRRVKVYKTRYY